MKKRIWVVSTASGSELEVSAEQAANIKRIMAMDIKRLVVIGETAVMTNAIMEVRQKTIDTLQAYTQPLLPSPTTELSEEKRQKAIERVREMKRKFLDDRARRTAATSGGEDVA